MNFDGVTSDGRGQTIAIVGYGDSPNAYSDVNSFSTKFGLPTFGGAGPTLTKVDQNGNQDLPQANSKWIGEWSLDVQWAHVVAPRANIVLVECDPSGNLVENGVNLARYLDGVSVVSLSYSGPAENYRTDDYFTTWADHQGTTFVGSTGDDGAAVNYPAASPNVLSVGGTGFANNDFSNGTPIFTPSKFNGYTEELGWNGSGGGISPKPQPAFQHGVVTQTSTLRTVPDVAWIADPRTGVTIFDSYDNGDSAPWSMIGGTSLSTPMWAGLIAVANQGRSLKGLNSLDGATQTLPILYNADASDFHDIVSGNNGYAAGPGYDLVTGRGTPIPANVIADLSAPGWGNGSVTASEASSDGYVDITWERTAGAAYYAVYRAPVDKTSRPPSTDVAPEITKIGVAQQPGVTKYSFVDTGAGPLEYRYFVVAVMKGGGSHDYASNDVGYRQAVQASDGTFTDHVHITWPSVPGAIGFEVVRAPEDATSNAGLLHISNQTQASDAIQHYDDYGTAPEGSRYLIYVTIQNPDSSRNTHQFASSDTGYINGVQATVGNYSDRVRITWLAAAGATSYDVFRESDTSVRSRNPTTRHLNESVIISAAAHPFYEDTTGTPGVTYRYFVSENVGTGNHDYVSSSLGKRSTATTGAITGTYFYDLNGSKKQDSGEKGIAGDKIFIDNNNNGKLDSGEAYSIADVAGFFSIAGLVAGTYRVMRVPPTGYQLTTGSYQSVIVKASKTMTGVLIGIKPLPTGTITGYAFNDTNKNGKYDSGDVLAVGKTIWLDLNDDGQKESNEPNVVSGNQGIFSFTAIATGSYHVRRAFPSGYMESTPARYITLTSGNTATGFGIGSKAK